MGIEARFWGEADEAKGVPNPEPEYMALREIIRNDSRTIYAIETTAGVPRGGVGRFLWGNAG